MTLAEEHLVNELTGWLGARWMHGQAVKGYATDCVQFLIKVGKEMDWVPKEYDPPKYNRDWALHNSESALEKEIEKFCNRLQLTEHEMRSLEGVQIGDVLLFKEGKCASHAGIFVGDNEIIHAHIRKGVVKEEVTPYYKQRLRSVWRPFPWQM